MTTLIELGKNAKQAAAILGAAGSAAKNKALAAIAKGLRADCAYIIEQNKKDLENAKMNGMSESMLDRLALNEQRIDSIAAAVEKIISLDDPVGKVSDGTLLPNGLQLTRVSVPLGVIAVIFEARPNVTADAAALCLKSGNAVILRGGKEAIFSNTAIVTSMRKSVESANLPADCIQLVEDTARETATQLMRMNDYVDVLLPRGGAGLIRSVVENASVPVIQTGVGNCHIYVDASADVQMATDIVFNAKCSRVSVCNACESLLVHRDAVQTVLPAIAEKLAEKNVEIYGDETVCSVIVNAKPATQEDWGTEYLDYKISVKTVDSTDEAIAHIAKYSTGHSEAIITNSLADAEKFTRLVDSAAVYVNASTRFTDGGEFGFGAEIGISTQKLHARGPVGLPELTSYKFVIRGNGQVR
ncbi:MAG: glutamate-5-semialdehyde dehydrogenase [Clostridia bacterium]|nr:glutamate-5-semialdehyde dehydrogenase [Clostridia bacterium]